MKCVCGYEGEDFRKYKLRENVTWVDGESGNVIPNHIGTYDVYACPKCGTLKVEVDNAH